MDLLVGQSGWIHGMVYEIAKWTEMQQVFAKVDVGESVCVPKVADTEGEN